MEQQGRYAGTQPPEGLRIAVSICTWTNTGLFSASKPCADMTTNYFYYRDIHARGKDGDTKGIL